MENKIRVIGYMPLLYGRSFLRASLLSVINHVEKMVILYTDKPSYGFGTTLTNPDSEQELYAIAKEVCGDKLIWHKATSGNEGAHRGEIYQYSEGNDLILAVDSDEVFCETDLEKALIEAYNSDKRYLGIGGGAGNGYINMWRSFNFACYDFYTPIRITNLKNASGEGVVSCKIWHFSTAQTVETTIYKLSIHGHKNEVRPNWLEEKFLQWNPHDAEKQIDLHLVAIGLWNATPYDKTQMPQYLKDHPFYNLEKIE